MAHNEMRDKLGRWLMAVCEEEEARPDVFCLSVAMMDLVLSRVEVSNSQLELLASACLLVSWKVREHKPISASRIVKYSQSAVTLDELLEWEVYILSALHWNLPTVVAPDLLAPLLNRVARHRPELSLERTRLAVECLLVRGLVSHKMSSFSPAVTAAAAVLLAIKSDMETSSNTSNTSNTSSPQVPGKTTTRSPFKVLESPIANVSRELSGEAAVKSPEVVKAGLERVAKSIQKLSLVDRSLLTECLETLQSVTSVPSSPPLASPHLKTPTKILEAATSIAN